MKKIGLSLLSFILFSAMLCSCTFKTDRYSTTKKSEVVAMLLDPEVRKGYREFKKETAQSILYQSSGKTRLTETDINKLNAISTRLVNRLHYHYHLNPSRYNIHAEIGKNEYNSCYQYYNSKNKHSMGKSCRELGSCTNCNKFIKAVRTPHSLSILHIHGWHNENITVLADPITLKNGESVYVKFGLSRE